MFSGHQSKESILFMVRHLGVVGAGTMGAGIAQLAALSGIEVSLYDINGTILRQALERIKTNFKSSWDKRELTENQTIEAFGRLHPRTRLAELNHAEIIVEAAIEELRIKKDLFRHLEADTKPTTILASTTSSLSITAIASSTRHPEKVLGLHFINSPGAARLVEIVRGQQTSAETIRRAIEFTAQLNKTAVVTQDSPGFIVNRLVQPFYGEALRILGERIADHEQIDRIMRAVGDFNLGPFESMDTAGVDQCLSVTQSIQDQTSGESRYRPHSLLKQMVDSGMLGRKSGVGFYKYNGNEK
jgi:3-hydroxybutyryl-CoA dehydrogenase